MTDIQKHIDELAAKVAELENKVTELENKLEWARLYGFSRNADDE